MTATDHRPQFAQPYAADKGEAIEQLHVDGSESVDAIMAAIRSTIHSVFCKAIDLSSP